MHTPNAGWCSPRRRLLACGLCGLALLAAGCGSGGPRRGSAAAEVSERDFHIQAPAHLRPGRVLLRVHNEGPDQHELIVVPVTAPSLPIRRDGVTIDEEALVASEPGSLDPGQPGSVRYLALDLKPGRYLFFCNMEGHFMGGMHREVTVG